MEPDQTQLVMYHWEAAPFVASVLNCEKGGKLDLNDMEFSIKNEEQKNH